MRARTEDGVAKYRQKVVNGLSQAYPHKEYHTNRDVFQKSGVCLDDESLLDLYSQKLSLSILSTNVIYLKHSCS